MGSIRNAVILTNYSLLEGCDVTLCRLVIRGRIPDRGNPFIVRARERVARALLLELATEQRIVDRMFSRTVAIPGGDPYFGRLAGEHGRDSGLA